MTSLAPSITPSKTTIRRFGLRLRSDPSDTAALKALNQWRQLNLLSMRTGYQASATIIRGLDSQACVVCRLKRLESILTKLRRFEGMALDRMQDIGGIRIVCSSPQVANSVVNALTVFLGAGNTHSKNRFSIKDYISQPKPSGYRSIHVVKSLPVPNTNLSLPIEIQIRTKLQHIWATAVETIGEKIKVDLKSEQHSAEWGEFLRLLSQAIALMEEENPLPYYESNDMADVTQKLVALDQEHHYLARIDDWSASSQNHQVFESATGGNFYVLSLHSDDLEITNFRDQNTAFADYTAKEAQYSNANHVLASTNNHNDLSWLYPNYYRDLRPFAKLVREILEKD